MSLTRHTLAIGALTLALVSAPAVAFAAPTYPPADGGEVSVSSTTPAPGDTITASANFYQADSDVDVTTTLEGDGATTGSAAIGGSRGSTLVTVAASGTCETGSTCTVVASSDGVATAEVALIDAGTTTITFAGTGADGEPLVQSVTVEVDGDADGGVPEGEDEEPNESGGVLSDTGARGLIETGAVALALLGIGALLVLGVRRRRDAAHPA